MSSVLVAGLGDVGVRTARQLLDTAGVDRVVVAARRLAHAKSVAAALHDGATPWELELPRRSGSGSTPEQVALPPGIDVIASALPGDADVLLARAAIDSGISFASAGDDRAALGSLLELDADASARGARVVVGCGLAPGLTDVLARHAAGALDTIDEVHVARWGVAGEGCAGSARRARRDPGVEWRDGSYVEDEHQGPELIWFPDPVGARECELIATGVDLLVDANPGIERATVRLGVPSHRLRARRLPARTAGRRIAPAARRDPGANWGAVRAEAWGQRGPTRAAVVYGVIEQTAVAAGTVLGVTAGWLAGALPELAAAEPGASGLGRVVEPLPFLAELARRGVKAAAFEGAAVA